MQVQRQWLGILTSIVILLQCSVCPVGQAAAPKPGYRQPVALGSVNGHLLVANRNTGSVTVIHQTSFEVIREQVIGKRLSELLVAGNRVFFTDESTHELIVTSFKNQKLEIEQRIPVSPYPVSLLSDRQQSRLVVASLWSRQLTFFDVKGKSRLSTGRKVNVGVAPREMCLGDNDSLLVAAASFDGTLELIDWATEKSLGQREIVGNNIRGLALTEDGQSIMISQQTLNSLVPTERERIFWGSVVGNILRQVTFKELRDIPDDEPSPQPIYHWTLIPLGRPGDAAGDPGQLIVRPGGRLLVALSGVNEIGFQPAARQPIERLPTGRRPEAILMSDDGLLAFVANRFDDSIAVIDLKRRKMIREISLGPKVAKSLAERGEQLFYDARLSLDGWYSCHSCHTDGHSNGQINDNFADGTTGAPKRVLSLLGTKDTGPWAWNADRNSLDKQVHKSILETMRGKPEQAAKPQVDALVAYLKTLRVPPSVTKLRGTAISEKVAAGRHVFQSKGCVDCHAGRHHTSESVYDVGIHDEKGAREFNPPSLRGVSQRRRFFHDNRAQNLEEVLTKYRHPAGKPLSKNELPLVIAYLRSL